MQNGRVISRVLNKQERVSYEGVRKIKLEGTSNGKRGKLDTAKQQQLTSDCNKINVC